MLKRIYPVVMLAAGLALLLTACSDAATLATKDYASQVARDNAESAKTNPASAVLQGVAGLVASLVGAVILIKRGITKYDAQPMEAADGRKVTEAEVVDAATKPKA